MKLLLIAASILMAILKHYHVIDWSWWIVAAPAILAVLWFGLTFLVGFFAVLGMALGAAQR